ncbi:UDP-N-acetylenolpyruvoylglucosamine reductase [Georgfuchsia toluolica]|uniref:UDP-N-acetylenolpyruvoylglucosamine reductase n=1 Tax=Georgfuchsia toluolica TaxID=424218 RepID=A0A916J534_9PROT|nr:UDP-N-acetylmuramate dehydrogenase [Georgfuchsia toluolica]CAG4884116.1 UDP-N-acetylenolpyruvoylglucosamine reductase [Georgfuchsia toluolica]
MADLRGALRDNEPMARHVSWRAGGMAAHAYVPADLDDLALFLRQLPATEPLLIVGLGSNLLVRDGGFKGTVVFTHNTLKTLRIEPDSSLIYVETGVASPKLAHFAAAHALGGVEFLAGIPGTVGGALAMNAGCHGSETWDRVEHVLMLNRQGGRIERNASDFVVGYRHVEWPNLDNEFFAAAWLRLPVGEPLVIRENIKSLLQRRIDTQPLQLPNAGSVFRNPPGDHAARLIEAAGLKGFSLGGARVSEKHANFIVNPDGRATASEIETLIGRVQATVREKFGVELVREVRIVGDEC